MLLLLDTIVYSIVVVLTRQYREYIENFSFSRKCRTYFLPHDLITLERPITIITQNVDGLSDVRHLTLLRSRKYTDVLPLKRALCKCIQITYSTDSPSTEGSISQMRYVLDCKRVRKKVCFSFLFFSFKLQTKLFVHNTSSVFSWYLTSIYRKV